MDICHSVCAFRALYSGHVFLATQALSQVVSLEKRRGAPRTVRLPTLADVKAWLDLNEIYGELRSKKVRSLPRSFLSPKPLLVCDADSAPKIKNAGVSALRRRRPPLSDRKVYFFSSAEQHVEELIASHERLLTANPAAASGTLLTPLTLALSVVELFCSADDELSTHQISGCSAIVSPHTAGPHCRFDRVNPEDEDVRGDRPPRPLCIPHHLSPFHVTPSAACFLSPCEFAAALRLPQRLTRRSADAKRQVISSFLEAHCPVLPQQHEFNRLLVYV